MDIHFKIAHTVQGEATPTITDSAERKLSVLTKYLGKYEDAAQVYVEFGKDSDAHEKGFIWCTQINLDCDGKRYHAKKTEESLEASLDGAINELESELRKAKDRSKDDVKKGGGVLKSMVRDSTE
jgi:ribosomal subunit interface protein